MSRLFSGRFLKYLYNSQSTLRVLQIYWAHTDRQLAKRLSKKTRGITTKLNDQTRVITHQLEIYRQVIAESGKGNK